MKMQECGQAELDGHSAEHFFVLLLFDQRSLENRTAGAICSFPKAAILNWRILQRNWWL